VDAIAADEVLLRCCSAQRAQRDVIVAGPMLSFEPYRIVLPRDVPELAPATVPGRTRKSRELAFRP
jgi:hypothetical protein